MEPRFKEADTVFLIAPDRSRILKGSIFRHGYYPNDFEDIVLSYFVRIEHMRGFTSCKWIPEDDLFLTLSEAQSRLRSYNSGLNIDRLFVGENVYVNIGGRPLAASIKSINNKVYPVMYHLIVSDYVGSVPVVDRSRIFLTKEDAESANGLNTTTHEESEEISNYNSTHTCV